MKTHLSPAAEAAAENVHGRRRTSVVQGQQHPLIQAGPVQVTRDGFARPAVQLQLLRVRSVRIRLGQDVAVAVLVEGVLQRVAVGGQPLG